LTYADELPELSLVRSNPWICRIRLLCVECHSEKTSWQCVINSKRYLGLFYESAPRV
jgi:hypothetical protein